MSAQPPSPERSANYGTGTLLAAAAGLIALLALLGVFALMSNEATARAQETKVVDGKISVLGGAKLRSWSNKRFAVQVPTGWRSLATGKVPGVKGNTLEHHVWHSSLDEPATKGQCDTGRRCLKIEIDTNTKGKTSKTPRARAQDKRQEMTRAGSIARERFIDLGPVLVPRDRWMWRLKTSRRGTRYIRYLFPTCAGGKNDAFWMIEVSASTQDRGIEDVIYDVLASLDLTDPTPKRPDLARRSDSDAGKDTSCTDVLTL